MVECPLRLGNILVGTSLNLNALRLSTTRASAVNLFGNWFFPGLDTVKRELPLLVGAAVYAVAGPDRWTWPRGGLPGPETGGTVGESKVR